jgi:hypothetical protein
LKSARQFLTPSMLVAACDTAASQPIQVMPRTLRITVRSTSFFEVPRVCAAEESAAPTRVQLNIAAISRTVLI